MTLPASAARTGSARSVFACAVPALTAFALTVSALTVCALSMLLLVTSNMAIAKEAAPLADDPIAEKRLMTLAEELRCLVCQNQNLADSHADLAEDLRREIREQIKSGASDEQIKDYLVARYGDFVLYRPRLKLNTVLLWSGPLLFVLLGIALLVRSVRLRRASTVDDPDDGLLEDPNADISGRGGRA